MLLVLCKYNTFKLVLYKPEEIKEDQDGSFSFQCKHKKMVKTGLASPSLLSLKGLFPLDFISSSLNMLGAVYCVNPLPRLSVYPTKQWKFD